MVVLNYNSATINFMCEFFSENISWIFDGIGTAVLIFIFGLIVGGGTVYKIVINKEIVQKQKARDNSNLTQIGEIKNDK
jgi:hypothetical protein